MALNEERQAGFNVMELRPGAKDAHGLRFKTQYDALRYAEDIADHCFALKRRGGCYGIDYYLGGYSYLAVEVHFGARKFQFTIARPGALENHKIVWNWIRNEDIFDIVDERDECQGSVLGNTGYLPYNPYEFTFPALVRLQRFNECKEFGVNAPTLLFHLVFEMFSAGCSGEIELWGKRGVDLDRGVAKCMVKCMADIGQNVTGDLLHSPCAGLEAEAINILTGINVLIDDDVRFVSQPEMAGQGVKVGRAFLGAFE